jgi:FMN phosphatase YigB (HAD superfamily)
MIKFIFFDVGGVVIDDFSGNDSWGELKNELGVKPEQEEAFDEAWYPLEHEVLVGRDIETLLPVLIEKFKLNLPDNYSFLNGFVSRFKANPPIWPIIKFAKERVEVGLLTNMYPGMFEAIRKRSLLPPVKWNAVLDSSIEMLKKPDKKLFELAESRVKVNGKEILFIDNSIGHIKEAEVFGWQVYHYDSSDHNASCAKLDKYLKSSFEIQRN